MLSHSLIKHIRSLHHKKFREEKNLFIVEGEKMVGELCHSEWEIDSIFATAEYFKRFESLLTTRCSNVVVVTPQELERISVMKHPNEVLAVVKIPPFPETEFTESDDLILILDRISDPGNLGTILRIADWFGISRIVCSPDTVELYNPKVVQATMGSIFRTRVIYQDLKRVLSRYSGHYPAFGAVLEGENIFNMQLPEKAMIIIGNESHGISPELLSLIDYQVTIPSYYSRAESLNASVAAAILCVEFRKNKLKNLNISH